MILTQKISVYLIFDVGVNCTKFVFMLDYRCLSIFLLFAREFSRFEDSVYNVCNNQVISHYSILFAVYHSQVLTPLAVL